MTLNPYRRPNNLRRVLVTGGLAAGTMLGAAGIASATTGTSTTATSGSSSTATTPATGTPPAGAAQGNPATMTHGPGETLLTGTQLQQATAAAAAVPGATVIRAETNSSGDYPYEVHLSKSDGTDVTVELDSNFKVITTISGFGAGPAGSQAPSGTAPSGSSSSSTAATTN